MLRCGPGTYRSPCASVLSGATTLKAPPGPTLAQERPAMEALGQGWRFEAQSKAACKLVLCPVSPVGSSCCPGCLGVAPPETRQPHLFPK